MKKPRYTKEKVEEGDAKPKAKKSLGQHFLNSDSTLAKIIEAGDIAATDTILEVGPGRGVLTEKLLEKAGQVIAIEKDRELVTFLEEKFAPEISSGKLRLLQDDILKFDPSNIAFYNSSFEYKVIANIPYYITGAIIRLFLETKVQPKAMVILIQKEVADRIMARDKYESLLSLSVKAFGTPSVVAKVPRGAFSPPPKVDSAILKISPLSRDNFKRVSEKIFFVLIHAGFAHKRKKLFPNLKAYFEESALSTAFLKEKLSPDIRAERLTLENWLSLAQSLKNFVLK